VAGLIADDPAREYHVFAVRAHVLRDVPLTTRSEVEHRQLH
jgi:hypothetical protein